MYDSFNENNNDDDSDVDQRPDFMRKKKRSELLSSELFGTSRPGWNIQDEFNNLLSTVHSHGTADVRAGRPDNEAIALPFFFALLAHKTEVQCTAVLDAIKDAVAEFRVPGKYSDFERGIHNACSTAYFFK